MPVSALASRTPAFRRHGRHAPARPASRDPRWPRVSTRVCSATQRYDVVSLGNLCVDVVVQLPQLPSTDIAERRQLLDALMQSSVPEEDLEVGGNCNFIVAAARLGLQVAAVGHTGRDQFGDFLVDTLKEEADSLKVLTAAKAVFTNGFIFDELPFHIIHAAISKAASRGAAVFFDPGPRCFTMQEGERREQLHSLLRMTDVMLMTLEEAISVTGESNPEAAAKWVLQQHGSQTKWCVVKLGGDGSVAVARKAGGGFELYSASPYQVEVVDTVGCGDSFAAAIVLGYLQGQSLHNTLQLANAVGAATATGRGAGRNVATAEQVFSLLEQQAGDAAPVEMLRSSLSSVDPLEV